MGWEVSNHAVVNLVRVLRKKSWKRCQAFATAHETAFKNNCSWIGSFGKRRLRCRGATETAEACIDFRGAFSECLRFFLWNAGQVLWDGRGLELLGKIAGGGEGI